MLLTPRSPERIFEIQRIGVRCKDDYNIGVNEWSDSGIRSRPRPVRMGSEGDPERSLRGAIL